MVDREKHIPHCLTTIPQLLFLSDLNIDYILSRASKQARLFAFYQLFFKSTDEEKSVCKTKPLEALAKWGLFNNLLISK